jgi:predicted glycoside hydrolase/deacetylase ChbG (UPF0249 family)
MGLYIKFTVDDFGCTLGINSAVEMLHRKNIVNYASVLVYGNQVENAVEISKRNPKLQTGLHLAFTDVHCERKIPGVTSAGFFKSRNQLIKSILLGQVNENDIYKEIENQFNKLISLGFNVKFINGHQDVHVLPIINRQIIKFSKKNNIKLRGVLSENYRFIVFNYKKLMKEILAYQFQMQIDEDKKFNDYFLSNMNSDRNFSVNGFEAILKNIANKQKIYQYEWGVHPSFSPDGLEVYWDKRYISERVSEFNVMNSSEFLELLIKYKVMI